MFDFLLQFSCVSGRRLAVFLVAASVFSAGPLKADEPANPDADLQGEYYASDVVQEVHLSIAEDQLQRMYAALPERIYVPAVFRWRDRTIPSVAVRFKGNSSSNPDQKHKRSFLVRFDKYEDSRRFLGMRRVSFDNGVQFGSLFSEPVVTEILQDLDVPVHRCNYARLYLNEQYYGVYGNVERIDDTFLERQFGHSAGYLFKVDEGGPGGDLRFIGPEPTAYERAFELKEGEQTPAYAELLRFLQAVNTPQRPDAVPEFESEFETESFLRVMAVMLYSGAFDQLTGWNSHNYYLYRDPLRQRWRYLPWDLDVGFCELAFGRIHVLRDWHAAWPAPGGRPSPLLEQFIASPRLLAEYRRVAGEILEQYFQPEVLSRKFDAKYALIQQALEEDPFPKQRVTNPSDRGYGDIVRSMKQFAARRYEAAKQQLKNPGPRPQPPRQSDPQPQPGPPSADAPSDLRMTANERNTVVLKWTDNCDNEAGTILQRAEGAEGGEFRNLIGQPGRNITEATDRSVRVGMTYRYRVYSVMPTPRGMRGTGVSNVISVTVAGEEK